VSNRSVRLGFEFEVYVMQPGERGGWVPYPAPGSFVYDTGHFSDPSLTASRLGVLGELECPPPATLDGLENVSCEVHVPGSLTEALDELEGDERSLEPKR